jgi:tRNA threonylcarbamoyladenosine biosynthesis protein TsaB
MPLILNIETAINVCSVALFDGEECVGYRENTEGKSHAALLTVFIDDLLKSHHISASQLSAVAVSMGPGSYTGLRIGISAAKGLCYGASLPLIAINTLQVMVRSFLKSKENLKEQIPDNSVLCPMIDGRRQEVYTALFNSQGNNIGETHAVIVHADSFQEELLKGKVYFFGNGADKCIPVLNSPNALFTQGIFPSAMDMAGFSLNAFHSKQFQDPAYFEPYYLKDFVATLPRNKVLPPQ